jgi:hypothetical protein
MRLTEENYREKIQSYTALDWKPLLELIPIIEKTEKFSEIWQQKYTEDGVMIMPYIHPHEVFYQFDEIVYKIPIIISFDWGSWDEGRRMLQDESFNFDSIDIPTKCKLISAIVRNDRFCEGALVSAFRSGEMLKILKSIERQITSKVNTFNI